MTTAKPRNTLQGLLDRYKIPYTIAHQAMTILGPMGTLNLDNLELPEHLVVQGNFRGVSLRSCHLPRNLDVQGDLQLTGPGIQEFPENLSACGNISLHHSAISVLPDNLNTPQSLVLTRTPITLLPPGLHVGMCLDLRHTRVRRLPEDLFVQGFIYPTSHLQDVQDFMKADRPGEVLALTGSGHDRMHLLDRLAPYPDLSRIVSMLPPHYTCRLGRDESGRAWIKLVRV